MKFDHVNLAVSNLDRSREFYEKLIGLKTLALKPGPDGKIAYAVMGDDSGSTKLELAQSPNGSVEPVKPWSMHIAFTYEDYETYHALHAEAGCIQMDDSAKGLHFIADPDGYSLEIMRA